MEEKTIKTEEELTDLLLDLIKNGFKQVIDEHGIGVLRAYSASFNISMVGEKMKFEIKFTKKKTNY